MLHAAAASGNPDLLEQALDEILPELDWRGLRPLVKLFVQDIYVSLLVIILELIKQFIIQIHFRGKYKDDKLITKKYLI